MKKLFIPLLCLYANVFSLSLEFSFSGLGHKFEKAFALNDADKIELKHEDNDLSFDIIITKEKDDSRLVEMNVYQFENGKLEILFSPTIRVLPDQQSQLNICDKHSKDILIKLLLKS